MATTEKVEFVHLWSNLNSKVDNKQFENPLSLSPFRGMEKITTNH